MTPARIPLASLVTSARAITDNHQRGGHQIVAALAPACRQCAGRLDPGGIRTTHYAVWTRHRPQRAPWLDGLHFGPHQVVFPTPDNP